MFDVHWSAPSSDRSQYRWVGCYRVVRLSSGSSEDHSLKLELRQSVRKTQGNRSWLDLQLARRRCFVAARRLMEVAQPVRLLGNSEPDLSIITYEIKLIYS